MLQNIFLSNYELEEALNIYFEKLGNLKFQTETIKTWDANGRVAVNAEFAIISSPHYNSSAVDGIAVKSEKTSLASDRNHVFLTEDEDYIVVDTGDPIPREFDCVIMVEDLIKVNENKVEIYQSAVPWQNIRLLGEDIVENQLIVTSKHKIRPMDIGALIAGGINELEVFKRPRVGIIPTGTEIVEPGTKLKVGDIIDFNSRTFAAQVSDWGGIPKRYDIVKDDYEKIKKAVLKANNENDIVLINAGSSAGREDFTSSVISEVGELIIHGIAIKPGKPVMMGVVDNKPIIGIPGFPVSAYFVMEAIAKKLILRYQGIEAEEQIKVDARLTRRCMSSLKYLEFVRVKLGYIGESYVATPLTRGAGVTMSLVNADGVLEINQSIEGIEAGTTVKVKLLSDENKIKNTLICIGSHDPIIDIASDIMHKRNKKYYLSSSNVGSTGGLMALKTGETHVAPTHLLDMETGEYNTSYLKKYLPDKKICLVKCVKRIQGFMVKKGNPKNIKTFDDIAKEDVKFVNRQRGSGTRLLLDYNLNKLKIDPKIINGYYREEFTHLAVAAAVEAGDVDAGLGVYSAAAMMGLEFIPVCNEEYDLAIPEEFMDMEIVEEFIETLKSKEFKEKLDELGGYDYSDTGRIIYQRG
ncbi:MAG: molybdopterin biosynthesis protein [Sedimentibacter sp.]|uniref:molybdopterin biosynthesis protein n=1 Tax=Sedimentibacter sp. TaxID=1960295 RepID=UPI002982773E|nr:molybdopterin biosynthesis protein [Sedimentibacter sp.]MDW5298958.1 molybdopterin biosynthesis protein [Sedimentibacter sp.]